MRGSWRPNRTATYWPPFLWPSALCLSRSLGLLNRRPEGPAFYCVLFSLPHLVSNSSDLRLNRGSREPLLLGGGFPYHTCLQLFWSPTQSGSLGPILLGGGFLYHILSLTRLISNSIGGPEGPFCWVVAFPTTLVSNSSELQLADFLSTPSYIIVQSPAQSLEWHVWSSSSGNNCHAVHRSLFPVHQSMSVPWDFYLVPFFQPSPPTRFLLITAVGMCHFLPVHHFGMVCLSGSKVSIQHYDIEDLRMQRTVKFIGW